MVCDGMSSTSRDFSDLPCLTMNRNFTGLLPAENSSALPLQMKQKVRVACGNSEDSYVSSDNLTDLLKFGNHS